MIQAHDVYVSQQRSQAVDAPPVTGPPKRLPIIDGIAPQLPLCAEIVGRNAGNKSRPVMFIQQKQFWVGSDVARVRRNEKGQVTDQVHGLGANMFPQPFALAEQKELGEANLLDRFRQVALRLGQDRRLTPDQFCRPLEVANAGVPGFQRSKQSVVV
jgi:hypothetical protein